MAGAVLSERTRSAYDALAPFYDAFTASYDYEKWLRRIESHAMALGLRGRRLLDLGCGTGKSFMPLLRRGYEVTGCDISPAMAALARRRAGARGRVIVADMRELPTLGEFDLVTCLDDGLNYLLSAEELAAAFAGVARHLPPGGIFVFDLNSLATYHAVFAGDETFSSGGSVFSLRGDAHPAAPPGLKATAVIDVLPAPGENGDALVHTEHTQRHHPPARVRRELRRAGLDPVDVFGQLPGARLERPADEERHTKLLYFARRR